jgi:hypothetical protein
MEMLPPAPVPSNVVVGVTIVKRFPGYGVHRGTIAELDIDGGKVLVHWSTTDERTTLSLTEAAKRVVASPLADEEDDDQSVRRTPRTPSTRRSGARGSKGSGARTRSSTGSWCRSPVRAVDRCASAAATSPPPRRRRAPAAARHH